MESTARTIKAAILREALRLIVYSDGFREIDPGLDGTKLILTFTMSLDKGTSGPHFLFDIHSLP